MATLADVARRAGVSTATVSRIINNSPKPVAEALRERVLAAVAELDYVPNANAQQLARAHRSAVGVIVHDVSDPYFAEITRGLQRVATEHGRLVIICNSYREPERELAYVDLLHAHRTAAIVLAGSGYVDATTTERLDRKLRLFESTGGRVAVIGRHEHAGDAVVPQNEHGGWLAADALYRLGHTTIGVIAGPEQLTTTTDRLSGVRRAAREHGHRLTARHIEYAGFDRSGGVTAAAALLDRNPGLTAIAALNDSMAVGALSVLRERGLDVPGRISLIGFDDMPISMDVTPPLSTVRLPLEHIGQRAMALALDEAADGQPRVEHVEAELVLRGSTAPPG
ncbi:LacI family DNA-binding transcriptional regulator [Actinoplanes sp. N902-109]|uniref:LacI family DNA-binding transcriptional regulator n=1 Tax=Actinoplanes sp. (strain N902-109) TaxID=649831 RepID=UPI0003295394|nr:LacI family DNA-binding transcriptional regulator [Actinoplanes sp. N902-109]AGL17670.1 LacI family transcriptional regulator [Actinoplanes sp. N902-109]